MTSVAIFQKNIIKKGTETFAIICSCSNYKFSLEFAPVYTNRGTQQAFSISEKHSKQLNDDDDDDDDDDESTKAHAVLST